MIKEIMKEVFHTEGAEIIRLADYIDYKIAQDIVAWILNNPQKKVFFTGCGTSGVGAKKATHTFSVINIPAFYINPSDAVHGALGKVGQGDMVVLISKGGSTRELTAFLDNLKQKKAYLVAVTENENSVIAKAADKVLKVAVEREPDSFNMLATASTLAVIALFDAIAIALMKESGFSKETFLTNHPSGDVGARLQANIA